ncbi:phage minor head protein [Pseudomonas aeruginosa]|uniref:phage head morphogenesis protein n=1 Tax=Pseudomonas aeruginosa TaxID=287 RepID=UPI0030F3368E
MATPTEEADLRAIFAMRPEATTSSTWSAKASRSPGTGTMLTRPAHARALTVAKAARLDVLRTSATHWSITWNVAERCATRATCGRSGGQGLVGTPDCGAPDGGAEVAQLGSPRRLETIYQTNMQSAYMAGRYAAAYEARETHPYWMYVAVMDSVTRPSHAALLAKCTAGTTRSGSTSCRRMATTAAAESFR